MSIEFKPGRYFIGVWFTGDGRKDWMAAVWRDPGEEAWTLKYRFRYYESKDLWDNKDTKNWYEGTLRQTSESEVERGVHQLAEVVSAHFGRTDFCAMHSDDSAQNLERLKAKKWASARYSEDPNKWQRRET